MYVFYEQINDDDDVMMTYVQATRETGARRRLTPVLRSTVTMDRVSTATVTMYVSVWLVIPVSSVTSRSTSVPSVRVNTGAPATTVLDDSTADVHQEPAVNNVS